MSTGDLRPRPKPKTSPNHIKPKLLKPNHTLVLLVNNKSAPTWERLLPKQWLLCSS